jgi:HK97 family phage prohead protease
MDQPRARAVHGMIKGGLVSGLSIGFRTKSASKRGRGRIISALDLVEVSVVRDPSHPRARITSAKQFDSAAAIASALHRAAAHLKPRS